MLIITTLIPLVCAFIPMIFLLMSNPHGMPSIRNGWHSLMYVSLVASVVFEVLAMWPHANPAGDAVATLRESMRLSHQSEMLALIAVFFGATSLIIFLLKCLRRTA
jgi:hypothetical protein